jgi:uncharacterized repeat protein (TIGR01451 family)
MRHTTKLALLVPFLLLLVPANAVAETTGPRWTVSSVSRPTNFAVGATEDSYVVLVTNTGGAVSEGSVTITDELPAGLEALPGASAEDELLAHTSGGQPDFSKDCAIAGSGAVSCTYSGVVQPDDTLFLRFPVRVTASGAGGTKSLTNVVRVSGGGASAPAAMETPTSIFENAALAKAETPFGVSAGGATTALSSVQAGAHPDITTTGAFNTENASGASAGNVKNITTYEPPGFALDLVDTPACTSAQFLSGKCPTSTQVGVTTQIVLESNKLERFFDPVYNLTPEPGDVAKIGFKSTYEGDVTVRPGGAPGEYGGKVTFFNVTGGIIDYDGFSLTLWGVPAAAIHDPLRWHEGKTGVGGIEKESFFGIGDPSAEAPYFTNPTECGSEPLQAELSVTSWQHPHESENPSPTGMEFGPIVGCDRLLMAPVLKAEVTSDAAYSATGFDLDTGIPQTYPAPESLATSTLKQEVVTLPEGMTVNPSSGAGLSACSEAQYAEETAPAKTAEEKEQGHGCPNSSKLATVRIKSPSIAEEVTGSAYLAEPAPRGALEPGKNPFNTLLSLYLVARASNRGVLVKAPGLVSLNQETGRITTTFGPTPEFDEGHVPASPGLAPLPASDISFQFNQGANAPLVTPPTCNNYTVTAALTPWSTSPVGSSSSEGSPLTPKIPSFPITTGVGGGLCPSGGVPPFAPGVTAGTENNDAGSYSPLNIRLTRNDGEQEITGFASQLPPGLTGNLSGIPFCSEAQIAVARGKSGVEEESSPSCPAASEIGHSVGSVLAQAPGKLYLGGPFDNAPFSIVSITSAHVGPFDLGTVVVHLPLDINPETAAVTIPSGAADQIPHIIKGIVVHIREIRMFVNRQNFMLNPTSCNPFNFSATVIGGGAEPANPADNNPVTVSTPFRVTACQALKFEPKFQVSTSGKTSKALGASLHVDLTYPTGALGSDSNIKEVKVDLPKQLPSRLTTLQKACTAAQFASNPAGCPSPSIIGTAKAITPILPVPLEGPAYFVSHGGEAFPDLEIVLQGDGVKIVLTGNTFISKEGVTSSTFKTVPDQPVTSFELTLPEGPFSALGTNKDLCALSHTVTVKKKETKRVKGKLKKVTTKTTKQVTEALAMPTAFVGQNGAEIHETTPVSVTGCPKAVKAKKKATKRKKGKKGKK